MKTCLALFTLLGLVLFTGCSADDLTGPDAASNGAQAFAQTSHAEDGPSDTSGDALSITGAWRASDRLGSITLFFDEVGTAPTSGPNVAQPLEGKGLISGPLRAPFAVAVEGQHKATDIAFTITDTSGKSIAKAQGAISTDFSSIKVVLLDEAGQERPLVFDRF